MRIGVIMLKVLSEGNWEEPALDTIQDLDAVKGLMRPWRKLSSLDNLALPLAAPSAQEYESLHNPFSTV